MHTLSELYKDTTFGWVYECSSVHESLLSLSQSLFHKSLSLARLIAQEIIFRSIDWRCPSVYQQVSGWSKISGMKRGTNLKLCLKVISNKFGYDLGIVDFQGQFVTIRPYHLQQFLVFTYYLLTLHNIWKNTLCWLDEMYLNVIFS